MSKVKTTFIEFLNEGKKEDSSLSQALCNQIIEKITNKKTSLNTEFTFRGIKVISTSNTNDFVSIDLYKSGNHIVSLSFDYMTKELVFSMVKNYNDITLICKAFSNHYAKLKCILDGELNQEVSEYLYAKYIDILEKYDFTVHVYDEKGRNCGIELESWTSVIGINQINFLDLRDDNKNIYNIEDLHNEFNDYFIKHYDMEDDYKTNMNDKSFSSQFGSASGKRKVMSDLKNWYNNVMKCKKELDALIENNKELNSYINFDEVDTKVNEVNESNKGDETNISKYAKHKPTNKKFLIGKIRKNGNVELSDGKVISKSEFELNWKFM